MPHEDAPTLPPAITPACSELSLLAAADLQDHLLVASNDMDRLQRLLGDACDSLLVHFHGAAAELQSLLQFGHDVGDGAAGRLRDALRHIGGAITAMQFQDMASQLVTHTTHRLRGCADRLALAAMGDDDEDGEALLETLPLAPNPVTQDEMDAGSVELF